MLSSPLFHAHPIHTSINRFPLDLIKVTQGAPLFSAEECASAIYRAEEEGVDKNEYKSGKYRLGGEMEAWVDVHDYLC